MSHNPYRNRRPELDDGWNDPRTWLDDEEEHEADDGANGSNGSGDQIVEQADAAEDDVAEDLPPDSSNERVVKSYRLTVAQIAAKTKVKVIRGLRGIIQITASQERFLGDLILEATAMVGGASSARERHRKLSITPKRTLESVQSLIVLAVATKIRRKVLATMDPQRGIPELLKIAAAVENKDPNDFRALGIDQLSVETLRIMALVTNKQNDIENNTLVRLAMLTKSLSIKEKILTLLSLSNNYQYMARLKESVARKEELLVLLLSGIEADYAASDMEVSLPARIFKTRMSLAVLRGQIGGTEKEVLDDERIAACKDFVGKEPSAEEDLEMDIKRDALETLIQIYKARKDFREALVYAKKVLELQREHRRHGLDKENAIRRVQRLARQCRVESLDEALRIKDRLTMDELLEWASEAEADGNIQAAIDLRETLLIVPGISKEGQIKTLVFLSYNYEEIGEWEKALLCMERTLTIKRELGEDDRRARKRARDLLGLGDGAGAGDSVRAVEHITHPLIRDLLTFLSSFQSRGQDWLKHGNIVIPAEEKASLKADFARILRNEGLILGAVGNNRLRGLLHKLRDGLNGGNIKMSLIKQLFTILDPAQTR